LRKCLNKSNKKGNSNSILNIFHNGSLISDSKEIADKFNEFFSSIAENIVSNIPNPIDISSFDPLINNACDSSFKFSDSPLTKSEISEAIDQLKPKTSLDLNGISSKFVKKLSLTLSTPLYHIFSKSFESGQLPTQLKTAKIVPLFKLGDKSNMDNYRPIALLNVFSKIIEKIVCNHLSVYLENNSLFSPNQYGFRKNHSTLHPMVHFMNKILSSLENHEHSIAIF
jgi:Reverse transcriptase (RNA-dependent DNA polymerase)